MYINKLKPAKLMIYWIIKHQFMPRIINLNAIYTFNCLLGITW